MEDFAIKVENVSKIFRLPHEKTTSVKGAVVNFWQRDRTYEKQKALDDVSFEVKKGEFFGIVGRNGSGKSTLLKLLAGIYSPSSGQVHVRGKLTPFIELGVGFNPELTGRENVYLNGALLGFNRKEMAAMYDDIVKFAELKKFMDQKLKNYSSGMQVRLAFSIAIRAQSDILLIDEVLAVGDAAFQQKCFNYFEELKSSNRTVVFVTHDMSAVRRFCDRAIYIKDGLKTHEGLPDSIANEYTKENINTNETDPNKLTINSDKHMISTELQAADDGYILHIRYKSEEKHKLYVVVSVMKNAYMIGGITSENSLVLKGSGKVSYKLDTKNLNGGAYVIQSGLYKLKNRELLAIPKKSHSFVVNSADMFRDGALYLDDTWELDSQKK